MSLRLAILGAATLLAYAVPAAAQPLSLQRAIEMAVAAHPDSVAAAAGEAEARHLEAAARAAWLPRVSVYDSVQRGNQPVFVFGSRLDRRRFTDAHFAIPALNHPSAVTHHRGGIVVRQPIFDPASTRGAERLADAEAKMAVAARQQVAGDVAVGVAETYGRVLAAEAAARAASAATEAALAGRDRAIARRDAGMATEADVLSLEVHLAQLRVTVIETSHEARLARASLNRQLGAPPGTRWDLADLDPLEEPMPALAELETTVQRRPDVAGAALQVDLARAAEGVARAALRPRVGAEGGYEWNGGAWADRAGSWAIGVRAELTLSAGGGDLAAIRAAERRVARAEAQYDGALSAARLDVEGALARVEAARLRDGIGAAAVGHARESARIVRDRYDVGLATTNELLRAEEALLDAEALAIAGHVERAVAAVALDRAAGRIPAAGAREVPR